MDRPAADVEVEHALATWPGRLYVGVLVGMVGGFFRASGQTDPTTPAATLPAGLSVLLLALFVSLGVTAFFLSRSHLVYFLLRNVVAAVAVFGLTVAAMTVVGVTTTAGIYGSPPLRLLLSTVTALLVAEVLTVGVFLLVVLLRGAGGNGKTPEEKVLGDDLDL
jgi:hypothetical protein